MSKVVCVTGGARGIGRAIVLECLAAGHDVGFTWLSEGQEAETLLLEAQRQYPARTS